MNSDGSRPFYTFVGWFSEDHHTSIPDLEALEASWSTWASEEYPAWMPLDWDRHQSDLTQAHEPPKKRPPWASENEPGAGGLVPGMDDPAQVREDSAVSIHVEGRSVRWRNAAADHEDVTLVVGLPTVVAGAAEATDRETLPGALEGPIPDHPGHAEAQLGSPEAVTRPAPNAEQPRADPPASGSAPSESSWAAPVTPPPTTRILSPPVTGSTGGSGESLVQPTRKSRPLRRPPAPDLRWPATLNIGAS